MSIFNQLLVKLCDGTLRRFLFFWAVAFWLGGFMFYGGVVIDAGAKALGSHRRQGFITQQVTNRLNQAGAVALPLMLWNVTGIWRHRRRSTRVFLAITWLTMAAVQIELFLLHPMMDRLLDTKARAILDDAQFIRLHVVYLTSSTVQWLAGLVHVWCAVLKGDD